MKLSICIPNYNKSQSLINLLNDIAKQTEPVFEILICDDFSKPQHLKAIENYLKISKLPIKLYKNSQNMGMMKTINKLIHYANGDYISIFHNDDRASYKYVSEFKKVISSNNFNIYTCNGCAVDSNLKLFNQFRIFNSNKILKKIASLKYLSKIGFLTYMSINGSSVYKADFLKNNTFDYNLNTEADFDSSLKFLSYQDIYYLDVPLYFVTINQKTQSTNIRKNKDKLYNYVNNILKILNNNYKSKNIGWFYYNQYMSLLFYLQIKNNVSVLASLKNINKNIYFIIVSIFLIFYYLFNQIIKKVGFYNNKNNITKYLPNN